MTHVEPQVAANQPINGFTEVPWGVLADLGTVTPETFIPHVGDVFQVVNPRWESSVTHVSPLYVAPMNHSDGTPVAAQQLVNLELVEVTRFSQLREKEGGFNHRPREPFSLLFKGQAESMLMNASLPVCHDQLGRGRLLFSAVQVSLKAPIAHQKHIFYEVIFG